MKDENNSIKLAFGHRNIKNIMNMPSLNEMFLNEKIEFWCSLIMCEINILDDSKSHMEIRIL